MVQGGKKKQRENSFPGKGNPKLTGKQRERVKLKKKLRDEEIEYDILKKAIAVFPEGNRKNIGL